MPRLQQCSEHFASHGKSVSKCCWFLVSLSMGDISVDRKSCVTSFYLVNLEEWLAHICCGVSCFAHDFECLNKTFTQLCLFDEVFHPLWDTLEYRSYVQRSFTVNVQRQFLHALKSENSSALSSSFSTEEGTRCVQTLHDSAHI